MNKNITAVLLGAGESSRFWPLAVDKHKSMYEVMGKPVIHYTIQGLKKVGIDNIIIVTQPTDTSIKDHFGDGEEYGLNIDYAVQEKPLGMGNAIQSAQDRITTDHFFILNADQVNADDLAGEMLNLLGSKEGVDSVLASQQTDTPYNYGILEIDNGMALGIEEKPAKGTEKSDQMVIGIYLLPKRFLDTLNATPTSQYAYEEALEAYIKKHRSTAVCTFQDIPEITLKFPWHLFRVNRYLMDKFLIEPNISKDAKISPTAIIAGNVFIGDNVRVFENAVIKGPCYISDGAIVGNNALIRDYSYIGRKSIVGYNTEIKHSIMYDRVETHKNYIGDSIVDDDTGFGAGTITANRRLDRGNIATMVKGKKVDSGMSSFGCIIGRNVHTGIHTGLMPGVKIGRNANIGAITNVTKDVEDDVFLYSKQDLIKRKIRR